MQTKEELELERSLLACDCERESKYKNDISALYFIKALRFNFDPSLEELIKKTRPDIAKKYFCPHFRVTSKEQAQEFIKKSFDLRWEAQENTKKFLSWHTKKSDIDTNKTRPFFHEREVWFISLGANVGFEQNGKGEDFRRPVIVVRKFNSQIFLSVPLTSRIKEGKYYFSFNLKDRGINTAILSQIRLVDAKRLQYKIGTLENEDFETIKQKLKDIIS